VRAVVRVLASLAIASGCAATVTDGGGETDTLAVPATSGEIEGVPLTWNRDHLMDDSFFEAKDWASAEEIQRFLERTVWDRPSWLARETVVLVNELPRGPMLVSEAIVRTAQAHRINPLLLLARMQVEKSLVSRSTTPPAGGRAFAFGCYKPTAAHPNGRDPANAGFEAQLECAATTLENQIANARNSQNNFLIRHDKTTEDGVMVRPAEAATSALYAYTPVEGTKAHNGNYLVWMITRRFAVAIQSARQ